MKVLVGAILILLGGCATAPAPLLVTYESDPPGATLYQNGQPVGITPRTLQYPTDETFRSGGCKQLPGTQVKWASGASSTSTSFSVCAAGGRWQKFIHVRPDVPGREIDANYALELQRNQIMQDANAINASKQAPPLRCVSKPVGNTVQTRCH